MAKYRKKPIIIDAVQYTDLSSHIEDGFDNVIVGTVVDSALMKTIESWYPSAPLTAHVQVPYLHTLEGKLYIARNDYIITGIKSERYPCKPDIFEATYETAE